MVSWGPREESVSRREQLLIPHVHIATAESCFYLRFLPVLVHMYVFFFSLPPLPWVTCLLPNDSVLIFSLPQAPGPLSLGLLSAEFK